VKRVDQFTEKDAELNRKIRDLEGNAANAIESLERSAQPRLRKRFARASGFIARPGDLVYCDTGVSLEILLVSPQPEDEGREIIVVKSRAGGTVTLRPLGVMVNGAATTGFATVGLFSVLVAEGAYWH
jgi:hypothetical protein